MLTAKIPTALNGPLLEDELAAAGLASDVYVAGDELVLSDLNESQRGAAQTVLAAHAATARAESTREQTEQTNATTLHVRAGQALAVNTTFLALPSQTNAQLAAQVKALTRQNNGLIRLILNRFDATD